jgi:drug/metabolite transporter (DMT)-like permease
MKINKGILYMIASGLCFMFVNFFVKILSTGPSNTPFSAYSKFPIHELVLFRSIISFSISAYILKKNNLPIIGKNRKWLVIRGTAGMIALTLFFYTIQELPIAISSTLQYLAPIFTLFFATYWLKEKIKWLQWICIFIALSGVFVIGMNKSNSIDISQFHSVANYSWIIIGVVSAMFSGLAYVSVVKLKTSEHPLNVVIAFPIISLPIMAIWSFFDFVVPQGIEWLYILLLGIFTQIAQVFMTKAFMFGDVAIVSPFQYLGSIYAILVGTFLFDEILPLSSFTGIFLILSGVLLNILVKYHFNKKLNGQN